MFAKQAMAVVQAYHHYTMIEIYRKALPLDNTWADAERFCDFMNAVARQRDNNTALGCKKN